MAVSHTGTTGPLAYRPGLDAVRAVAMLLVVLGHWTHSAFPISSMGGPTYIALSGYFISGIVWKKAVYVGAPGRWPRRLGVFFLRRLTRTLPPYYVALLAGAALPLVTLHQYPLWFIIPASNLLFFKLQSWGEGLGHYWTMAVDEQFYVLWPVLLAVMPRRIRWLLLLALGSLLFRIGWYLWNPAQTHLTVLLPACLDVFAAGGILSLAEHHPLARRLAHWGWVVAGWSAWGLVWAAFDFANAHVLWEVFSNSISSVSAVLTLNWVLHQPTRPARENRLVAGLQWIGQRSYGFYLYHLLLPVFYQRAIYRLFALPETRQLWLAPLPTVLLLLPVLSVLAWASWMGIEAPLNRWRNRLSYTDA